LVVATNQLMERLKNKNLYQGFVEQQIQLFYQYNWSSVQIGKIALPVIKGLEFNATDVIRIKGENVY
jgi:hypothetical protein